MDPNIRKRLRDILAKFYPDEPSIRRVAADAAIDLSRVPLNNSSVNNWHKVLSEAEFVNQLDALLDVVEEEYAANETLQRICDAYRHAIEQIPHEHLVSHIERVGEQLSESQAHEQTTEDHALDQSNTEATVQETFQIERAVCNHPDFAELLRQSEFVPKEERNGRELIVVRPKVAITCQLPIAISGGSCHIEFSEPFLRGLIIDLGHKDVLEHLVAGRNTPFHWNTRRFIRIGQNGNINLSIDLIEVLLTEADAIDLCECVDVAVNAYVSTMVDAENTLEAWNRPVGRRYEDSDKYGYELLTVSSDTWDQILRFGEDDSAAIELGYRLGLGHSGFEIITDHRTVDRARFVSHAQILPKLYISENGVSNGFVTLLYFLPGEYDFYGEWEDEIGSKGLWSVDRTNQWLQNKLFPLLPNPDATKSLECTDDPKVFWKMNDPHLFAYHLGKLQWWSLNIHTSIATSLLIDYCEAFNKLYKNAIVEDITHDRGFYIMRDLYCFEASLNGKPDYIYFNESWREEAAMREKLLSTLSNNIECLKRLEHISVISLRYLFSGYYDLIRNSKISTTQSVINNFKKTLWPLFEYASFELRFTNME